MPSSRLKAELGLRGTGRPQRRLRAPLLLVPPEAWHRSEVSWCRSAGKRRQMLSLRLGARGQGASSSKAVAEQHPSPFGETEDV